MFSNEVDIRVATCSLLLTVMVGCDGYTPPFTDGEGNRLPGSIAVLQPLEIGGIKQWVLIRGRQDTHPVLLWLHGGPGASEMPVVPYYNNRLEEHFVVVHWDQRGAGKSNPKGFDESTMTFQQFVQDAHEMSVYLKKRFHRERIYLLGHSWGSHLGLVLAHSYPEDYWAYIGVSQHVSAARSHPVAHDWLEKRIRSEGGERDLQRLERLGPAPYRDHDSFVEFVQMVDAYGGNLDVGMPRLAWVALRSPHYTVGDMRAWLRGAKRGSGPMWDEPAYQLFDAHDDVPWLDVPAYFFNGARDYNTPLAVTRTYFEALEASRGKRLVVFEQSAHTPFLAEPTAFERALIQVKEETWPPGEQAQSQEAGPSPR